MRRRDFLLAALGSVGALRSIDAQAATRPWTGQAAGEAADAATLTPAQSRAFRAWMVRIVAAQLAAGPTPRWQQRDCAGLVRFAVAEALRVHDEKWRRANGLSGRPLPPEIQLADAQQVLRHRWRLVDGSTSAYVGALALVQENTRFITQDCNLALPGDLLFYDHNDAQHLMIWMGSFIAYHTGTVTPHDTGLRSVALRDLLKWPDTRWHPSQYNPNFAGVYRLAILSV